MTDTTSQSWLSKNWLTVALAIAALVLTWVLFRGCAAGNTHVDKASAIKDTIIANLKVKVLNKETQLAKSQKTVNDLANKVATTTDTAAKFKYCDSLAGLVLAKDFQIQGLTDLVDSTVNQMSMQLQLTQEAKARTEVAYNEQSKAMASTTQKYDGLYKDYNQAVKANKFNKTLSRILAGVVLVIGGALILK